MHLFARFNILKMLKRKLNVTIIEPSIDNLDDTNDENSNPLLTDKSGYSHNNVDDSRQYHSNTSYLNSPQIIKPIIVNYENNHNRSAIYEEIDMKSNKIANNNNKSSFKQKVLKHKLYDSSKSILKLNSKMKNKNKMQNDLLAFSSIEEQNSRSSVIIPVMNKKLSILSKSSRNEFYSVELRVVFLKVGDIDTLNEKFYAEAFIEAKWFDPNLSPDKEYNAERDWNPKMYILNCLGDLKQEIWFSQYSLQEYEQEEKENKHADISSGYENEKTNHKESTVTFNDQSRNGSVIVERRKVKSQFWQTLDLKNFPCDVQQLTITLTSPKPSSEIELKHCKDKASSVNTKAFADSQEWTLYKLFF